MGDRMKNFEMTAADAQQLNCLQWAMHNRIIRDGSKDVPFSIDRPPRMYPFLKDLYYSVGAGGPAHTCLQKPRQVGATEWAINSSLYIIDVLGVNVIYMLPGQKELRSFAGARVNDIIRTSPHIRSLFSDIDNLDLKVGTKASLYLRGSHSAAGLEEVPAGAVIRDEIDLMSPDRAAMALQALGGSFIKIIIDLSHATEPEHGINLQYLQSSQQYWAFACPHCSEVQDVSWDNNVDIENEVFICRACKKVITKDDMWKGFYISRDPKNPTAGFHFSQLISPTVTLHEQIDQFKKSKGRPYLEKIFYNTVLALPYAESAQRWTEEDVRSIMIGHPMSSFARDTVMGVDVGSGLHLWVQQGSRVVYVDRLSDWSEIIDTVKRFDVKSFVADAGPEYHKSREVCAQLRKMGVMAWVCSRSDGMVGNRTVDEDSLVIKVNKTEQFDEFYSRLADLQLPSNFPQEAIDCLTAPIRTTRTIPSGGKVGIWVKGIAHYADAGSYAMEAQKQMETPSAFNLDFTLPEFKSQSRWRGATSLYGRRNDV